MCCRSLSQGRHAGIVGHELYECFALVLWSSNSHEGGAGAVDAAVGPQAQLRNGQLLRLFI